MRLLACWLALAALAFAQSPGKSAAAGGSVLFQRLANDAETARKEGRTADAVASYSKALKLKPAWNDGWWFLGTLQYGQDQYADARDSFRRLTALDRSASPAWAMLGLCEFETREYSKARAHLERAEQIGIPSGEQITDVARYHLALLFTRDEQYEEAGAILSRFAQQGRQEPQYVEALGIAALRKPLLPSEVPPVERELIMATGRATWDATARRVADADNEFKTLLETYPKQPNLHFLFGSVMFLNDSDQGLALMKQELEISPNHLPALVSISSEYLRRKEFQAGLPFAERAVETAPQSFAAHAVLGRLLAEGEIDQARGTKELETAVKLAPGSPQSRFALATAYAKAGRKTDAARERAEFLKLQSLSKSRSGEK